jgi:hypothetical protein
LCALGAHNKSTQGGGHSKNQSSQLADAALPRHPLGRGDGRTGGGAGSRLGRGGTRLRHPSRTTSQGEWQGLRFIPARPIAVCRDDGRTYGAAGGPGWAGVLLGRRRAWREEPCGGVAGHGVPHGTHRPLPRRRQDLWRCRRPGSAGGTSCTAIRKGSTSQGEWEGPRFIPARPHRCMPGRRHDVSRRRSTGWAGCSSSGDGREGRSLAGGSGRAHGLYPASPSSYAVPTAWCRRLRSAGQGTAGPGGRRHTAERNLHGDAAVGRG